MKKLQISLLFSLCFILLSHLAEAQAKKPVAKKTTTAKKAVPAKTNAAPVQVADAAIATPPPAKDTVKPAAPAVPPKDPFAFDSIKVSLRNDASVDRNLIKARTPLS